MIDRTVVAWLRKAMAAAEQVARATTSVPVAGQWVAVRDKHAARDAPLTLIQGRDAYDPDSQDYGSYMPVIAVAAEWQDEVEANLRHIALNDPAAVLRRVAGDRKTLDECVAAHDRDNWGAAALASSVVRNLAESYGWTEVEEQRGSGKS